MTNLMHFDRFTVLTVKMDNLTIADLFKSQIDEINSHNYMTMAGPRYYLSVKGRKEALANLTSTNEAVATDVISTSKVSDDEVTFTDSMRVSQIKHALNLQVISASNATCELDAEEDPGDDILYRDESPVRYRTDKILVLDYSGFFDLRSDDAGNYYKAKGNKIYSAEDRVRSADEHDRLIALYIGSCMGFIARCGIVYNGVHYNYYGTSASGYKQGQSVFLADDIYSIVKPNIDFISELGLRVVANGNEKWNVYRDEQCKMMFFTSAGRMFLGHEFMKRIAVIDTKMYLQLAQRVKLKHAADVSIDEQQHIEVEYCDALIKQDVADGFMPFNSDFAVEYDRRLIQVRGAGVKAMAQGFSFSKIAQLLGNEDFEVSTIDGSRIKFKECSAILDKNSFKYIDLYIASGLSSFEEFSLKCGFDDLYAVAVYEDHTPDSRETFKLTKQMFQFLELNDDVIEEITKYTRRQLDTVLNESKEQRIERVRKQCEGRAFADLVRPDIANGNFIYTKTALEIQANSYYSIMANAFQGHEIKGNALKLIPYIPDYVRALIGEKPWLGGDTVVVKAAKYKKKVLVLRNPVIGFDYYIADNAYRYHDKFNDFVLNGACYTGFMSTLPKRLAADWDGDTVNVTTNEKIISCYDATASKYDYPAINFEEVKEIRHEEIKHFENTDIQRGRAIGFAFITNRVGCTSAFIARIAEYMLKQPEERRNAIYKTCIVPMAQGVQNYVDASKRGDAVRPNLYDSELTDDELKNLDKSMPGKDYLDPIHENDNPSRRVIGYTSDIYPMNQTDDNGRVDLGKWTGSIDPGCHGFGNVMLLVKYLLEKYPLYNFMRRTVEDCQIGFVLTANAKKERDENPFSTDVLKRKGMPQYIPDNLLYDGTIDDIFAEYYGTENLARLGDHSRWYTIMNRLYMIRQNNVHSNARRTEDLKSAVEKLIAVNGIDAVYDAMYVALFKGYTKPNGKKVNISLEFFMTCVGEKAVEVALSNSAASSSDESGNC